jgi:hypothetical protein
MSLYERDEFYASQTLINAIIFVLLCVSFILISAKIGLGSPDRCIEAGRLLINNQYTYGRQTECKTIAAQWTF